MYEPSRLLLSFHIAGFQYWDGCTVLSELKAGDRLELVPEPDNPHDPEAVAIYRGSAKLGFVPQEENGFLALMLHFGHRGDFEVIVQQVAPDRSPWHQVRAGIYVTDAR